MSSLNGRPGSLRLGWSQCCVGDVVVVYLTGELDMSTLAGFRLQLGLLVGSVDAGTVVLDLSELEFISAGAVEAIRCAREAAAARGMVLCVDGLHGIVARAFELLGLESLVYSSSRRSE